jgi:aspartate aminotransferase
MWCLLMHKVGEAAEWTDIRRFMVCEPQGFASGSLEEDAFAPRFFVEQGLEIFVAQSYSKNLGLYAERIGAINVVANDKESALRTASQMKRMARAMYSNPPVHGARIVAEVVGDDAMFAEWKAEMQVRRHTQTRR